MHAADGFSITGASADSSAYALIGGRYGLVVTATWNSSGTVGVDALAPDGSTWVPVTLQTVGGPGITVTANGTATCDLPAGTYRIKVATATGVSASLATVPF